MGLIKVIKKLRQWVYSLFRLNTMPVVKVYHGFGDYEALKVHGHVFSVSPFGRKSFKNKVLRNALALIRLFMVKTKPRVEVTLHWMGQAYTTTTEDDGFFGFEWTSPQLLPPGWHDVAVLFMHRRWGQITGQGKIFIPGDSSIAFISDIDDTFLISHSSNLRKRLYVLLTSNARTRKPFEGVVRHYQLLAWGGRPFFYVSSSEWNLYDYIRNFADHNGIPDGVYLLNQIKHISQFLKTGQHNHNGKYFRIVRLLKTYEDKQFVLLGDDSQQDPFIYQQLAKDFPGRILCIYLRHVREDRYDIVSKLQRTMQDEGGEVCYFRHSEEAIAHSRRIGLIKD